MSKSLTTIVHIEHISLWEKLDEPMFFTVVKNNILECTINQNLGNLE